MKLFNISFLKKDEKIVNKEISNFESDKFGEIGKLVKESRIKKNLSIEELSEVSKIPESTIKSIENNIKEVRPKYPFIRSILLKLEECLSLRKNELAGLATKETNTFNKGKKNYIIRKFDFINTWKGSIIYFLFLILSLFIINRYFISNIRVIEIQIIEEKSEK